MKNNQKNLFCFINRRIDGSNIWVSCNFEAEWVQSQYYRINNLIKGFLFKFDKLSIKLFYFAGDTMFFRVKAVSEEAISDPSIESCCVTMGENFGKFDL